MKEIAEQITNWIRNYAVKNDTKSLVIGVSGGVDSALVSTLCAKTGLPTHCVVIPCQSKPDGIVRANKHVVWLQKNFGNVVYHILDLTSTFESFQDECEGNYDNDLGYANTKSRLRMIALYQLATCFGGIVVGTGNKVEDFGIGFFTKYGDGGVDISPIADLMKTEVRQMCRDLGVLPELSEAVPTDGLWDDNRTDETQVGATYAELEWALGFRELAAGCCNVYYMETPEFLKANGLITDRQAEVLSIYDKRHAASKHKLEPIPSFRLPRY